MPKNSYPALIERSANLKLAKGQMGEVDLWENTEFTQAGIS